MCFIPEHKLIEYVMIVYNQWNTNNIFGMNDLYCFFFFSFTIQGTNTIDKSFLGFICKIRMFNRNCKVGQDVAHCPWTVLFLERFPRIKRRPLFPHLQHSPQSIIIILMPFVFTLFALFSNYSDSRELNDGHSFHMFSIAFD